MLEKFKTPITNDIEMLMLFLMFFKTWSTMNETCPFLITMLEETVLWQPLSGTLS